MQAILENTTTKFKQYFPNIQVISDNPLYLVFEIDVRDYQDGEYEITLFEDDNRIIGKEIIKIGDFKNTNKIEYKVEKKFTQYVRK